MSESKSTENIQWAVMVLIPGTQASWCAGVVETKEAAEALAAQQTGETVIAQGFGPAI